MNPVAYLWGNNIFILCSEPENREAKYIRGGFHGGLMMNEIYSKSEVLKFSGVEEVKSLLEIKTIWSSTK